jgi:hypothetical protein
MSGILKSKVATYEFGLKEVTQLVAADLGVPASKIDVEFILHEVGGDPMDRYPGTMQVAGIRVRVNQNLGDINVTSR